MSALPGFASSPANRFLSALSPAAYEQIRPDLERVSLNRGQVVYECSDPITHVFFPDGAVVTLVMLMADGTTAEVGVAGLGEIVGVAALFDDGVATNRAVVQVTGSALRIRASALRDACERCPDLRVVAMAFALSLLIQVSHTAVCNAMHPIERRLARWLLAIADRVPSDDLPVTHETIAAQLGTHRPGISAAADALRRRGLITYNRGHVHVVDRGGLERAACGCYRASRADCERALDGRGAFRLPVAV